MKERKKERKRKSRNVFENLHSDDEEFFACCLHALIDLFTHGFPSQILT